MKCKNCYKTLKLKHAISLQIGGRRQPFHCCSYKCLLEYITDLTNYEDDGILTNEELEKKISQKPDITSKNTTSCNINTKEDGTF